MEDLLDLDMDAVAAAIEDALNASQEQLNKLVERIRKALARAEDTTPGDEGTRETAKRVAAELMGRYGITAAMLADTGQITAKVDVETFEVHGPYINDKASMLATVVSVYGGRVVRTESGTYRVFGMDSDMVRIKLLWSSLLTQLTNEMAVAVAARTGRERRDVFERSFILNFSQEVGERIRTAEAKAVREFEDEQVAETDDRGAGKSVALVLAGRKGKVDAAVKVAFPKLSKGRSRKLTLSAEGLAAGRAAGQRADIGTNNKLSGGGRRALR